MTPGQGLSIYCHVPFCRRRCGYCGFYSVVAREEGAGARLYGLSWRGGAPRLSPLTPVLDGEVAGLSQAGDRLFFALRRKGRDGWVTLLYGARPSCSQPPSGP